MHRRAGFRFVPTILAVTSAAAALGLGAPKEKVGSFSAGAAGVAFFAAGLGASLGMVFRLSRPLLLAFAPLALAGVLAVVGLLLPALFGNKLSKIISVCRPDNVWVGGQVVDRQDGGASRTYVNRKQARTRTTGRRQGHEGRGRGREADDADQGEAAAQTHDSWKEWDFACGWLTVPGERCAAGFGLFSVRGAWASEDRARSLMHRGGGWTYRIQQPRQSH